jgi:hypothetical protein
MYSTYVHSPKMLRDWARKTNNRGPEYADSALNAYADSLPIGGQRGFRNLSVDQIKNNLIRSASEFLGGAK